MLRRHASIATAPPTNPSTKTIKNKPQIFIRWANRDYAIQVASFLHRELPIRLAHRVRDLESVPDMLAQKSVQQASRSVGLRSFVSVQSQSCNVLQRTTAVNVTAGERLVAEGLL